MNQQLIISTLLLARKVCHICKPELHKSILYYYAVMQPLVRQQELKLQDEH